MKKIIVSFILLFPLYSIASEWAIDASMDGYAVGFSPSVETKNGEAYMTHNGLVFVEYTASCDILHNSFKVISFNDQPIKTKLMCTSDQVLMIQPRTDQGNNFILAELSKKKSLLVTFSRKNSWRISTRGYNKTTKALEKGDHSIIQAL